MDTGHQADLLVDMESARQGLSSDVVDRPRYSHGNLYQIFFLSDQSRNKLSFFLNFGNL